MGGNALKNTTTRRYDAKEYHALTFVVMKMLEAMFPGCRREVIKSYVNKPSFGDMDVLLESSELPADWLETVKVWFQPTEMIKNGNVLSFDYRELQIDIIVTRPEDFETSVFYFAYNDLGNLMGRIAHKMGLKLGHDGLIYKFRDSKDHVFREIVVSKDWATILQILGFHPSRYLDGFGYLEDIFKFVASSWYFNPDIYLLENRNHVSRVRDAKRKTYMEFLKWCKEHDRELWHYTYTSPREGWLNYFFEQSPAFKDDYRRAELDLADHEAFKAKFNGDLVRQWTGLDGKELGLFMKFLKDGGSFRQEDIWDCDVKDIESMVKSEYNWYKEQQ